MASGIQYQQPVYAIQPQMIGGQPQVMAMQPRVMGMQPQMMGMQPQIIGMPQQTMGIQPQMMRPVPMGAQMDQYGRVIIDSGDGTPARIYGGQFEGASGMQSGYQQRYAINQPGSYMSGSQAGYPQNFSQQPQMGNQQAFAQSYPQLSQPSSQQYLQGYPQISQPNLQPGYRQPSPLNSPQPTYQVVSQAPQQVQPQPASSPAPQSNPKATLLSTSTPPPPSYTPEPQPQAQQIQQPVPQRNQPALVQPATSSARQPSPSYSALPETLPLNCTPESQENAKSGYQLTPQINSQSNWQGPSQSAPQVNYLPVSQSGYATSYSSNTSPNSSFQQLPMQSQISFQQLPVQVQNASYVLEPVMTFTQPPSFLDPRDTEVRFQPISSKADTHHHALKSLHSSPQTAEALTAIIGSYLISKHTHEGHHILSGTGNYRHARPEVQAYSNAMDKLESLSSDYISKHKAVPPAWTTAIGPHRRHIFATLYNSNELVRAFCAEVNGGPLMLPDLDSYALGKTLTNFNFTRAVSRQPIFNAGFGVLSQVRTVILIDDSGSMTGPGHQSWGFREGRSESRWMQARNMLADLAPFVARYNPAGIDLHFLNRVPFYGGLKTAAAVQAAFDSDYPSNGTPTGQRVNDILDAYMCCLRHYRKLLPLNLIVITDGEAQDEHILHWTIEHHVTKIVHRGFPAHQFGIEFVQVGDCEYATRHLEKLEEEVSRHHVRFQRDVVGVTPTTRISRMDGEKLLGIAVSGIDARMNGYMRTRGFNV